MGVVEGVDDGPVAVGRLDVDGERRGCEDDVSVKGDSFSVPWVIGGSGFTTATGLLDFNSCCCRCCLR